VTFTPPLMASAPHVLRVPVRVNGSSRGAALALAGAGEAPRLLVEPASLDLGPALPGEAASAALVLRNAGAYAIRVRFQAWRVKAVQGRHPFNAAPPGSPRAVCRLLDAWHEHSDHAAAWLPGMPNAARCMLANVQGTVCQAALPHAALQVVAADCDSEYLEDERRLAAWEGWNIASHVCCPEAAAGAAVHVIKPGLLAEYQAPASARMGAPCAADAPAEPVHPVPAPHASRMRRLAWLPESGASVSKLP